MSLRVRPAQELAPGFFLVVFEEGEPDCSDRVLGKPATEGGLVKDLEEEIDRLKAQFRSAIEKHEASDEEMKASNDELQAMTRSCALPARNSRLAGRNSNQSMKSSPQLIRS